MLKNSFFALCFILINAQAPTVVRAQTGINTQKLELALNHLQNDWDLQYANLSFCAIEVESNQIVAQRNPNVALIPASSLKVITTATALAVLGKDFKFKTELQYSGQVQNGTLYGNLYIKGFGDPSLGSPRMVGAADMPTVLATWQEAVKKAGIQRIEGAVIGDGSYFDDEVIPYTWQWGDMGNYYGAGAFGLNFYDNYYTLNYQQTNKVGETPALKSVVPTVPFLKIDHQLTLGERGSGDNGYIFAALHEPNITVRGTIPAGGGVFGLQGANPMPDLYAAVALTEQLKLSGINCSRPANCQRLHKINEARQTFHTHFSPALTEIVKHINEESRNMYCEVLIKAMGVKKYNNSSFAKGIAVVSEFWAGKGVDMRGFFVSDGSGLSARNAIPSKIFAQIMRLIYKDNQTFGDFYNMLAVAGSTGTLSTFARNSPVANNIHAKSGSMSRVRSYTGYVTNKGGKLISFSIVVNNFSCSGAMIKQKLEEILIQLASTN